MAMKERKEELLHKLISTGAIHRFDRMENLWKEAFDLYYEDTNTRLSLKCGRCYTTVKEWLAL
jgi:hypothetical protein